MSSHHLALRHTLTPGAVIARHSHDAAYAAVVLSGGYEEAGECGRWRVEAGDVLLHGRFSSHWDQAPARGAVLLNLPLPADVLARLAERDPVEAAAALLEGVSQGRAALADAPDVLARALSGSAPPAVETWAREQGVTRETAFRWFRQVYGVAPARFRIEARARRAIWVPAFAGMSGVDDGP